MGKRAGKRVAGGQRAGRQRGLRGGRMVTLGSTVFGLVDCYVYLV